MNALQRLITHSPWFVLFLICVFAFFTRIYHLSQPKTYVFDEVYHAVTAKLIARNDVSAYEWWHDAPEPNTAIDWLHPPYAKYTQAGAMLLFGENSFGWRISSVIFGVMVIAVTYWTAKQFFNDEKLALLAALLASLDGLLLVQSRVAMNDIHVTFFIVLALGLYQRFRLELVRLPTDADFRLRYQYLVWSGLAAGMALGSKWSGAFVVMILGLAEGVRWLQLLARETPPPSKRTEMLPEWLQLPIMAGLSLIIIPAILYAGSYLHPILQGKTWSHFAELHRQIWWYQTTLEATHDYQSRPWQWFFNLRPVWFHVEHVSDEQVLNIYAQGNTALFWLGGFAVMGTMTYFVFLMMRAVDAPKTITLLKKHASLLFLLVSYFLVWVPWQFSPRIMFFYHYTPAVPLMSILLAYWLVRINTLAARAAIVLIAAFFVLWYPNWAGLAVPQWWASSVYFILPAWK